MECVKLEVSEEQRAFVSTNAISPAQAYGQPEQRPHAICSGGVGEDREVEMACPLVSVRV